MPKRVLDFDAMWASDKLASCAAWAQAEYAWFYGLADASGSFEITNLRVIWGRVAAIRTNLTLERLEQIFDEFILRGLLFTWEESGKRYAHWTGSDVPGRLPPPSWRARLEKLAPPVPQKQLAAYVARFSRGTKPAAAAQAAVGQVEDPPWRALLPVHVSAPARDAEGRQECLSHLPRANATLPLSPNLEPPQAQGLDLELEGNWNGKGKSKGEEKSSGEGNADLNAAATSRSTSGVNLPAAAERNTQTHFSFCAEKIAEQSSERPSEQSATPYRPPPRPAYYPRNERDLQVAKELYVGAGPMLGPHSTARVKPAAVERARRTEEAAAAARNARRGRPG